VRECFDACGDFIARIHHPGFGNMLLLHSDDVVCPPSYRLFRSLVKSSLFQLCMSPIPGVATSFLFSRYAELSRSKDAYRRLESSFLTSCVEGFLKSQAHTMSENLRLCVFGHIHVQLDDVINNVRFVSGPDWFSAPSVLTFSSEGQLKRTWLNADAAVPERFLFASSKSQLGEAQA
jgi:UDP-2,3-diacylglucosamine pyrophosphatase LpxH